MATSKNKSSSTGLRILWIPGRKRHNYKGKYESTKKDVDYSRKQKKSEPWSLGGSKNQRDFLKADSLDFELGPSPTSNLITTAATATCVVGGIEAASRLVGQESCPDAKIDNNMETLTVTLENREKDKSDDSGTGSGTFELSPRRKPEVELLSQPLTPTTVRSDDDSQTNDDEITTGAASSASTMPMTGVRKQNENGKTISHINNHSKKSNDLDSIEILDNKPKLSSTDLDSIDGSLFNYSTSSEKRLRKKKDMEEEKDEKCVTCLYYTCLCCDCTIS